MSVPRYPWQRERFWVENAPSWAPAARPRGAGERHEGVAARAAVARASPRGGAGRNAGPLASTRRRRRRRRASSPLLALARPHRRRSSPPERIGRELRPRVRRGRRREAPLVGVVHLANLDLEEPSRAGGSRRHAVARLLLGGAAASGGPDAATRHLAAAVARDAGSTAGSRRARRDRAGPGLGSGQGAGRGAPRVLGRTRRPRSGQSAPDRRRLCSARSCTERADGGRRQRFMAACDECSASCRGPSRRRRTAAKCRPDAAYLVTGGLGGVGLEVARWLVDRGARHLVLVGTHRDPSARADWGAPDERHSRQVAGILDLESRGARVESPGPRRRRREPGGRFVEARRRSGPSGDPRRRSRGGGD